MRIPSSRHLVRGSFLAVGLVALALFGPASAQNQAVPEGNTGAKDLARSLGFQVQRSLLRMYLGENLSPGKVQWQFAIADPALG